MKLSELKEQTGLASEEILAIMEQPEPNCPTLDSYREDIERHLIKNHVDRETHVLLNSLVDMIEVMRANFEMLRHWGQDWKDVAKLMMEDYDVNFVSNQVFEQIHKPRRNENSDLQSSRNTSESPGEPQG